MRHDLIEEIERDVELLGVHGGLRPAHHEVDRGAAGIAPCFADAAGDPLGGRFVALPLQLKEQRIEAIFLAFLGDAIGQCRRLGG